MVQGFCSARFHSPLVLLDLAVAFLADVGFDAAVDLEGLVALGDGWLVWLF